MGVHVLEFPELDAADAVATRRPLAPSGSLGTLSPMLARIALAVLAVLLAASAIVPVTKPGSRSPWSGPVETSEPAAAGARAAKAKPYDEDIALYEVASERIARGENYYDFIVREQRGRDYPVNPGWAVRLPTLAYLNAWLGAPGQIGAAMLLMFGIAFAWWQRFGEEGVRPRQRRMAVATVFVGASLALNRHYFPLHELWAGGLIALSFGLHRVSLGGQWNGQRGRWVAAFCTGALALAIREHSLPFVLLMAATALWRRNWTEAAAWTALVAAFAAAMAMHLSLVARDVLPGDPHSAPWLVMRGLSGWLANIVQSSNLRWLPHFMAGPAVILMTFGWLGLKGPGGVFGFLLCSGYGLLFALAGRWDNFYWGAMIAPAMFAGIVFAPQALRDLLAAARFSAPPRAMA